MNITDNGRAITTVTVSRTHSLREPPRILPSEDQSPTDNGSLMKNQRSLSNDKIAADCKTSTFIYQRGSSLRHTGKTAFSISNNHHSFQIIKPIDTSPRTSEGNIEPEMGKSSQKFKFKTRGVIPSTGGPLIPDHNLKMESQRDSKYTPRPPLSKRFSSDQEEASSDIDSYQPGKNPRSYSVQNQKGFISIPIPGLASVPIAIPMKSPPKVISHHLRSDNINCNSSIEKMDKHADNNIDYVNGFEDTIQSDCEVPPTSQFGIGRSSLRKGSDSPINSDTPIRNSPSPTKTVKWNPNLTVKNIPTRARPVKPKLKIKSNPNKDDANGTNKTTENEIHSTLHINLELVESHETYISQCTNLIRNQVSLLENFRQDKISLNTYQKDLIEQIEDQKKLISSFHSILTRGVGNGDRSSLATRNSEL